MFRKRKRMDDNYISNMDVIKQRKDLPVKKRKR